MDKLSRKVSTKIIESMLKDPKIQEIFRKFLEEKKTNVR